MRAITLRDGKKETHYGAGQHVHDGRIDRLEIAEHYEAVIHERPNIGGGAKTPSFQAGAYPNIPRDLWLDGQARASHDRGPADRHQQE